MQLERRETERVPRATVPVTPFPGEGVKMNKPNPPKNLISPTAFLPSSWPLPLRRNSGTLGNARTCAER